MVTDNSLIYLTGKRVILRPLVEEDFTSEYLNWLNDPLVNKYSQRRPFPISWEDMKSYSNYYMANPQKGFVLAIIEKSKKAHIGNMSLVNIQLVNRCAEIAVLLGNKDYWNKGYGSECMYLLTKHAFTSMNLHKIFVGSFNPAFVRCVEKIGGKRENIVAKLVGGGAMFENSTSHIGDKNVESARSRLTDLNIHIENEDTGGSMGKSVEINLVTGLVKVETSL